MKQYRRTMSATSLVGDKVINPAGEDIGEIEELMIDVVTGRVAYAVLSFGGFLGIGDKLFAVPWSRLTVDEDRHCFVVDVDRAALERAPGFDKHHWPDLDAADYIAGLNSAWGVGSGSDKNVRG